MAVLEHALRNRGRQLDVERAAIDGAPRTKLRKHGAAGADQHVVCAEARRKRFTSFAAFEPGSPRREHHAMPRRTRGLDRAGVGGGDGAARREQRSVEIDRDES